MARLILLYSSVGVSGVSGCRKAENCGKGWFCLRFMRTWYLYVREEICMEKKEEWEEKRRKAIENRR